MAFYEYSQWRLSLAYHIMLKKFVPNFELMYSSICKYRWFAKKMFLTSIKEGIYTKCWEVAKIITNLGYFDRSRTMGRIWIYSNISLMNQFLLDKSTKCFLYLSSVSSVGIRYFIDGISSWQSTSRMKCVKLFCLEI